MKKVLIAIPKGYRYIELSCSNNIDHFLSLIKIKAIANIEDGAKFNIISIDELAKNPKK